MKWVDIGMRLDNQISWFFEYCIFLPWDILWVYGCLPMSWRSDIIKRKIFRR